VQPTRLRHRVSSRSAVGWELLATTSTCRCYSVKYFRASFCTTPLNEGSRPYPYLRAGLRLPQSSVLSMARFRLSSQNLGVELGRYQGVVWFSRGCKRCAALGMHDLPVDYEAHPHFFMLNTASDRRGIDLHNCHVKCSRISHIVVILMASARPRLFNRGWGAIPLEVPRA
jgi:hypothetical protein